MNPPNSTVPGNPCYIIGGADPAWNCIPESPYHQEIVYTTLVSTAVWCLVVVLAVIAFRGIYNAKNYSLRRKRSLLCYIALMSLFSTGSLAQGIILMQNLVFTMYDYYSDGFILGGLVYYSVAITLPFAVTGADGLMAWRCWILYQGVNYRLRLSVCCLLVFLLLCSLTSAVLTIVLANGDFAPATPLLAVTITINLILSALIVSRLLYHEFILKKTLGIAEKTSPFRRVIAMCVESCALIVVFAALALGMEWAPNALVWNLSVIPLTLLPHICVVSPLLIIIRVANGRAPTTTIISESINSDESDVEKKVPGHVSIRFKRPVSTQAPSNEDGNFTAQ
ncbi:hypothetical protein BDN70DRAFT_923011 [Pholiota conissans]|uniref:Uncharacterized protein n=1 Tax=Pholiota conissans TaxID=109636 RepID=A0A9P6CY15_9AGAR|nr:hypothetical protein BDN70DRAFT_923011 [Pholiota conissans]